MNPKRYFQPEGKVSKKGKQERQTRKANKKISKETRKGVFDAETEGCTDGGAEAIGEDRG